MAAQLYTEAHWTVHFKRETRVVCESQLQRREGTAGPRVEGFAWAAPQSVLCALLVPPAVQWAATRSAGHVVKLKKRQVSVSPNLSRAAVSRGPEKANRGMLLHHLRLLLPTSWQSFSGPSKTQIDLIMRNTPRLLKSQTWSSPVLCSVPLVSTLLIHTPHFPTGFFFAYWRLLVKCIVPSKRAPLPSISVINITPQTQTWKLEASFKKFKLLFNFFLNHTFAQWPSLHGFVRGVVLIHLFLSTLSMPAVVPALLPGLLRKF